MIVNRYHAFFIVLNKYAIQGKYIDKKTELN